MAALAALRSSGSTGEIRAALEDARLTRATYRMGAMTFADAGGAFERIRTAIAARGPIVPETINAAIDFELGATTLLWGDVNIADPLISSNAAVLSRTTESPSERGLLSAYAGHAAMYKGRHNEAEAHFSEWIASKRIERDARNPIIVFGYVYAALTLNIQGRFAEAKAALASAPEFGASKGKSMTVLPSNELRSTLARIELDGGNVLAALQAMPPQEEDQSDNLFLFGNQTELRGDGVAR